MYQPPMRVVVFGAGERARQVIYPALAHMKDVVIEAVCEIDVDRRKKIMHEYGINKGYGDTIFDYQRMIQEVQPDACFVIGQPHILYDAWVWLLQHKIPLFIEKPMGITMHQARNLAYLAQTNNVPTQVAFQRRYTPVVQQALNMCRERGPITHAVCRFYKCEPAPFLQARDHMMDDTVHSIDTLRWICGGEIVKIESATRRIGTPDINFISATLHFDNGSLGYLINSWSSGKRIFSVEIHAPGIFAEIEHEVGGYVYKDGDLNGIKIDSKQAANSDRFEVFTGVEAAIMDFINSIRTGKPSMCHFGDAVKTMEVAEYILAQAMIEGRA